MHGEVFTELSLVIVLAAVVAFVMRSLRQPLIMGYILTGILVGPAALDIIHSKEAFATFSEIGIALLLFIIGLELSVSVVKKLGRPVILTALALLMTVGTLGYVLSIGFGFSSSEAVIAGLALFFSSTIIIAKVLSDKKELTRLNGQIAIGVILVDDIIATFALLYVAAQSNGSLGASDVLVLIAKGIAFVIALIIVGSKVLPKVTKHVARSHEQLFLFALAWGFGVASLMNAIGFSIEVGALFAGVALAHLPYAHQIGARLKPLRDFFVILFFISLGERLQFDNIASGILPALILSLVVLIVKPLAVMTTLGLQGYTRRTSFKAGINLSQISEFSIILVVLAVSTGLVSDRLSAIITLVAIITIAVSTYLMKYDNQIYDKVQHKLKIFERKKTVEKAPEVPKYDVVLFGYKNGGKYLVKTFQKMGLSFLVVDYNPDFIKELAAMKVPHLYGDLVDEELLGDIMLEKAKLVINTVGDHSMNQALVRHMHERNKRVAVICYSKYPDEAEVLYALGATYVVMTYHGSSNRLGAFIEEHGPDKHAFIDYREHSI